MTQRKTNSNGDFPTVFNRIAENVERVIQGKGPQIRLALTCLLAEGHLLIEDVPGVGKTLLAKSIARLLSLRYGRIQFTPDLMPADIVGTSVYDLQTRTFNVRQGPVSRRAVSWA